MPSIKKKKALWPLIVIVIAGAIAAAMVMLRPKPKIAPKKVLAPLVQALEAKNTTIKTEILGFGKVKARHEARLSSKVSGTVNYIHPNFVNGAYFEKGEVLYKLTQSSRRAALSQAELEYSQAKLDLARTKADKASTLNEQEVVKAWDQKLANKKIEDPNFKELSNFVPQLQLAESRFKAAKHSVAAAKSDLAATVIKAPFSGYVSEVKLAIRENLVERQEVGRMRAARPLMIDMKLHLNDAVFIQEESVPVQIEAEISGSQHKWTGLLIHKSQELEDNGNRLNAVVEIHETNSQQGFDLPVGLFVKVRIPGKNIENVMSVPESVVNPEGFLWIIDQNRTLRKKPVKIRHKHEGSIVVEGLRNGDQILSSYLPRLAPGLKVRLASSSNKGGNP